MVSDLSNIPTQLRKMADDLESGTLQEKTCIVLLTSEESDDFASYFFGEEVTYGEAIDTVGGLLQMLEEERDSAVVVTVN